MKVSRTKHLDGLPHPLVEVFLEWKDKEVFMGVSTFTIDNLSFSVSIGTETFEETEELFHKKANEYFDTTDWETGLYDAAKAIQTRTQEEALEYCKQ